KDIRYGIHDSYTRLVIDLNRDTNYDIEQKDGRVKVSIPYARPDRDFAAKGTIEISNSPVVSTVHYEAVDEAFLITFEMKKETLLETPYFSNRIVIDFMHD